MSDSVQPQRRQPTRLPHPWDSPGKNTGVGCHFLLQCMKVKSQSEVAQSCPTLRDPMDCSPPGFSVHGIFQARVLEWVAIAFSLLTWEPVFLTAVSNNLCFFLFAVYLNEEWVGEVEKSQAQNFACCCLDLTLEVHSLFRSRTCLILLESLQDHQRDVLT